MSKRIGVLALQGGYAAHAKTLRACGYDAPEIRTAEQLATVDGLCLPGGESTTHLRLIDRFELRKPLDAFVAAGKPILATCAGLILSATHVTHPEQPSYGWLDVDVARNAWGRQVHSFEAAAEPRGALAGGDPLPLIFIRAPRITRVGEGVEVLAAIDDEPIMVRQGHVIGAAYHPELTDDLRVHRLAFG